MRRSSRLLLLTCAAAAFAVAADPQMLKLSGDIEPVHDPVLIRQKDTWYVFCTGGGRGGTGGIIPVRTSPDLLHWTNAGMTLPGIPEWGPREIPGARGAWAPDISFFHGRYHLYYSLSTFGSRNSAIGLATNATLDPNDSAYRWVDDGLVLRSFQDRDDWNAIDPNLAVESEDRVWLVWGSFWGGIKMRRLDPETGKPSAADTTLYSLCSRPRTPPIGGSVEAPFLFRHEGWWYLFASFDRCCRGADSTYNVVVGRSRTITGPYVDREGHPMTEGGGTLVIAGGQGAYRGPGHEAVVSDSGRDYLVFHAYDATTGRPSLHISTIVWENGWPRVAPLP